MRQPNQILATSRDGYLAQAPCCCCLHLRYERQYWRLSRSAFDTFCAYISDLSTAAGFAKNEVEPGLALVLLAGEHHAVLMKHEELLSLLQLLEKGSIALARRELESRYQAEPLEIRADG